METFNTNSNTKICDNLPILHPILSSEIDPKEKKGGFIRPKSLSFSCSRKERKSDKIQLLDPLRPNLTDIITAVAKYLYQRIDSNECCPFRFDIFNENMNLVDSLAKVEVTESYILKYILKIQSLVSTDPIVLILGILFIERITETLSLPLNHCTWKRLLTGCWILSAKIWEEDSIFLADFSDNEAFPFLSVKSLAQLESEILSFLEFNINWSVSDYLKTLFQVGFEKREPNILL